MRLAFALMLLCTLSACDAFSGPFSMGGPEAADGKEDRSGGSY